MKNNDLGDWLRRSRQIRGLTLSGIAEEAGASNQSNLSKLERGLIVPEPATMAKLAPYYGSPWLGDEENVQFIHAMVWALSSRIGYHPATDAELSTAVKAEFMLTAARAVVESAPRDSDNILRATATAFRGVAGLARMTWDETHPFWAWIWMQHALHIKECRRRITIIERNAGDEFENATAFEKAHTLESRLNYKEALLKNWGRWGVVAQAVESVRSVLSDPGKAWYQYSEAEEENLADDSRNDESPLDSLEFGMQSEWDTMVDQLSQRGETEPALRELIRFILRYPATTIEVLSDAVNRLVVTDSDPDAPSRRQPAEDDLPF